MIFWYLMGGEWGTGSPSMGAHKLTASHLLDRRGPPHARTHARVFMCDDEGTCLRRMKPFLFSFIFIVWKKQNHKKRNNP